MYIGNPRSIESICCCYFKIKFIVYDVVLNRGNQCDLSSYAREKQLPSSLKFGEYVALSIGGCDAQMVQEIEVKTNFGSYMFGPQN